MVTSPVVGERERNLLATRDRDICAGLGEDGVFLNSLIIP
jgi:hypothetical protein